MKTVTSSVAVGELEFFDQSYPPGDRHDWHDHPAAELVFVAEGGLSEQLTHGTLRCARHDLSFKPAGERHRVSASQAGARCLVLVMSPRWIERHPAVGDSLAGPRMVPHPASRGLCMRILDELGRADLLTPLAAEGLALELLACIGRAGPLPPASAPAPWLEQVRERLHDDPAGQPTLAELGAQVGVRSGYLAQAFRRRYRYSVGEYLRRLRVAQARDLLTRSELSLPQVAETCGFYDQSHFTRVFRRLVGTTPAKYRKRHAPLAGS